MKKSKIVWSFVATVLNEQEHIETFLHSIMAQTEKPDEIIIVDGGSKDKTIEKVRQFKNIRLFQMRGNRSVGRNYGIRQARGEIILLSDAGCVLDKNWVAEMMDSFSKKGVSAVAGYYKGLPQTVFEQCLLPYVFVMPDRLNTKTFFPAGRSMGFRKSVWETLGGFPEKYSHNEDYVFAKKLRKEGVTITVNPNAIVYWLPRKNIKEAAYMFFRFAKGDSEARILRPKVLFIFARYVFFLIFLLSFFMTGQPLFLFFLIGLFVLYSLWAITKNYRYVRKTGSFVWLPLLQIVSDVCVLAGTIAGFT